MIEGGGQGELEKTAGLLGPPIGDEPCFVRPTAREHIRQLERLRNVERVFHSLLRQVDVADEAVGLTEPDEKQGEVGVRLVVGDDRVRPLHPLDRLLHPAGPRFDQGQPARDPCRRMRVADRLVEGDRALEQRPGLIARLAARRHLSGTAEGCCMLRRVGGQLARLLEVPLGLGVGAQRGGPLGWPLISAW